MLFSAWSNDFRPGYVKPVIFRLQGKEVLLDLQGGLQTRVSLRTNPLHTQAKTIACIPAPTSCRLYRFSPCTIHVLSSHSQFIDEKSRDRHQLRWHRHALGA